jgi:hypothetical protein
MAIAAKRKPKNGAARQRRAKVHTPRKSTTARRPKPAATPAPLPEPSRSAPPLAEVDADALEFIEAIDRFKRQHGRPFPSWSEVLMVLRELGYRRG